LNFGSKLTVISGSERQPVRGVRLIHNSHPDQTVAVSIRLRPRSKTAHEDLPSALAEPTFEQMSRQQFERTHGADPADLDKIRKFALESDLSIYETGSELARRTVVLSGTVSALEKAFGVEL